MRRPCLNDILLPLYYIQEYIGILISELEKQRPHIGLIVIDGP